MALIDLNQEELAELYVLMAKATDGAELLTIEYMATLIVIGAAMCKHDKFAGKAEALADEIEASFLPRH
jgi:hypothetical protein